MLTLMPTLRWITIIVWLVWLVGFWNGGWQSVIEVEKLKAKPEPPRDTLTSVTISLLTLLVIATGLLVTSGALGGATGYLGMVGIFTGLALTLFGMAGTLYSRNYLGRFWTEERSRTSGQGEVERGPYGLVRHPIYLATILCYTGTLLVFPTWWNIVATLLVLLAYIYKTSEEELFLAENLPGFRDYQKTIPYRIIPGVW
jgi:protein-S-isoprenylcysteine O-methyltransferase Ste14